MKKKPYYCFQYCGNLREKITADNKKHENASLQFYRS